MFYQSVCIILNKLNEIWRTKRDLSQWMLSANTYLFHFKATNRSIHHFYWSRTRCSEAAIQVNCADGSRVLSSAFVLACRSAFLALAAQSTHIVHIPNSASQNKCFFSPGYYCEELSTPLNLFPAEANRTYLCNHIYTYRYIYIYTYEKERSFPFKGHEGSTTA